MDTNHNSNMKLVRASRWFATAKVAILSVTIFTLINMFLLVSGSDLYFLYSASVPYIVTVLAMAACGKFPPEYYGSDYYYIDFLPDGYFIGAIILSVVIIGLYLLCFFMLKKSKLAWMIVALVLFAVDTIFMGIAYFALAYPSGIIDIVFHVIVLVALSLGIVGAYQVKEIEKLSQSEPPTPLIADEQNGETSGQAPAKIDTPNSPTLRTADFDVKSRVFFEEQIYGHTVIFRRVKRTNELVIDGYVYGEYTALIERSHILTAVVDGHEYAVGGDAISGRIFIMLDGNIVKEKIRLI